MKESGIPFLELRHEVAKAIPYRWQNGGRNGAFCPSIVSASPICFLFKIGLLTVAEKKAGTVLRRYSERSSSAAF